MKAKASIRSKPGKVFIELFQKVTNSGNKSRTGKTPRTGKTSRATLPEKVWIFFGSFSAPRFSKRLRKSKVFGKLLSKKRKW